MKNIDNNKNRENHQFKSLLDNFERDKKISENNGKKYLKKINKTTALQKKYKFIRDGK